jgi:hypothetical protein
MNLADLRIAALRQRRAEYIRDYANRTGLAPRRDARMWALFFSALIRRMTQ